MIPKNLLDEINLWINEKKYGSLQINFSGGKIANVNRAESVKVESLGFFLTNHSINSREQSNTID